AAVFRLTTRSSSVGDPTDRALTSRNCIACSARFRETWQPALSEAANPTSEGLAGRFQSPHFEHRLDASSAEAPFANKGRSAPARLLQAAATRNKRRNAMRNKRLAILGGLAIVASMLALTPEPVGARGGFGGGGFHGGGGFGGGGFRGGGFAGRGFGGGGFA